MNWADIGFGVGAITGLLTVVGALARWMVGAMSRPTADLIAILKKRNDVLEAQVVDLSGKLDRSIDQQKQAADGWKQALDMIAEAQARRRRYDPH